RPPAHVCCGSQACFRTGLGHHERGHDRRRKGWPRRRPRSSSTERAAARGHVLRSRFPHSQTPVWGRFPETPCFLPSLCECETDFRGRRSQMGVLYLTRYLTFISRYMRDATHARNGLQIVQLDHATIRLMTQHVEDVRIDAELDMVHRAINENGIHAG